MGRRCQASNFLCKFCKYFSSLFYNHVSAYSNSSVNVNYSTDFIIVNCMLIQSVCNKIHEFSHLLNTYTPSIVAITESWLHPHRPTCLLISLMSIRNIIFSIMTVIHMREGFDGLFVGC